MSNYKPGPIALFGSGETSPSGRKIFDAVFRRIPETPKVALLETPAGFELNSDRVIGRVAEFLDHHLQNYQPRNSIVSARKRNTDFSPDDPDIVAPIYESDLIFMGPGSPTYAVRQLQDSLAWQAILARHRLGAALALASAAAIAISEYALPVYEIYKVGEDIHWKDGLNLLNYYGVSLVFIPHWNNNDGGAELDTNRCYMGQTRFSELVQLLPAGLTVVGIDEQTGLIINPQNGICDVIGSGEVTLIHTGEVHADASTESELENSGLAGVVAHLGGHVHRFTSGMNFSLHRIGPFEVPEPGAGIRSDVWDHALETHLALLENKSAETQIPSQVLALVEERKRARNDKDWSSADRLRDEIADLGWQVKDTPEGPELDRL